MGKAASSIAASFLGNAHKSLECALNSFLCCDKVHLLMTKSNNGNGQDAAGATGNGSRRPESRSPRTHSSPEVLAVNWSKVEVGTSDGRAGGLGPRSSNLRAQDGDKARKTEQQLARGRGCGGVENPARGENPETESAALRAASVGSGCMLIAAATAATTANSGKACLNSVNSHRHTHTGRADKNLSAYCVEIEKRLGKLPGNARRYPHPFWC